MNMSYQSGKGLNKGELINFIYINIDKIMGAGKSVKGDTNKIKKSDIERVLNMVLDAILAVIESGQGVNIVGFGSLSIKHRAAREGHNPKTGEKIHIPEHKQLVFKPGKALKDILKDTLQ